MLHKIMNSQQYFYLKTGELVALPGAHAVINQGIKVLIWSDWSTIKETLGETNSATCCCDECLCA
jgi:hypothetical protein